MNRKFRIDLFFILGLVAVGISACGSSGSGASTSTASSEPPSGTAVTQPTLVNLYPNQAPGNSALLTVMVTQVGTVPVSMPLGFDTGSAGVTLYAQSIFPAAMVNDSGFVFPSGETSMTYGGVTITNLKSTRSYGTVNQTVENGNLGFAQLTFGDAHGQLTTQVMPVFLFYSVTTVAGTAYAPPRWQGWFGVAGTNGTIDVAGSVEPTTGYSGCSLQTSTSCYVVSVMKYLDYSAQVNAGFVLNPAPIQTCDISTPGSCAPAPMLTVGLNSDAETGFSTTPLTCPPNGYVGPSTIAGYPVCQKAIPQTTFAVSGASVGSFTGYSIFDTGTPYMYFSTPAASSFPNAVQAGSTVSVTLPPGFNYRFTAESTDTANSLVDAGADGNSIVGIQYFTTNSFLIDFTSSIEGWK